MGQSGETAWLESGAKTKRKILPHTHTHVLRRGADAERDACLPTHTMRPAICDDDLMMAAR